MKIRLGDHYREEKAGMKELQESFFDDNTVLLGSGGPEGQGKYFPYLNIATLQKSWGQEIS